MNAPDKSHSRLFNASLASAIDLLGTFGADRPAMGLPELASAAGITKSAAQRYAHTFEMLGLLRKDPRTKKYSLTPKVLGLGYRYLLTNPLLEKASPYLLDLCRKCNETVNLTEPDGNDMVYIRRFETLEYMPGHVPIGSRLPIFCTASGRAYLLALPDSQVLSILQDSQRVSYTPATITDIDELMKMIRNGRQDGFACAEGEYYRADINIAAPILNAQGIPVAAINISAAAARWTMARMKKELGPLLLEAVRLVSNPAPGPAAMESLRTSPD